jgi:DNA-directed RNA polymerase subunit alpha
LNLKKVRFVISGDENQTATLKIKGAQEVKAKDIKIPGQVTITNPEQSLFTITSAGTEVEMEITIEKGIGFVSKEVLHKDRVDIGAISLDATFSPILQANYDVDQMRVGDRTDFNRLKLMIQTDGTITAKDALEKSIEIMITQLKAIIGFKEEEIMQSKSSDMILPMEENHADKDALDDVLKTRIESIDLSQRTANALVNANIRTVGGLIRKKEEDILEIAGLGSKGLEEIKSMLESLGLSLKA